jgi:LysM repeat protein
MNNDVKHSPTTPIKRSWLEDPVLLILILAIVLSLTVFPGLRPAMAKPLLQGGDVLAQVNALRAANGLAPYRVNNALTSAAQAHSDYQAATGNATHTGSGGTSPTSRAVAAGYGGSAKIFVSENIASGMSMTPANAVEIWQGDSLHLNTMLSPNYTDAGAGVSSDGQVTYITLDVGYVAGQAGNNPGGSTRTAFPTANPGSAVQATAKPTSKGFVVSPVMTVTPQPDGSIIHIVQPGEVLLNIAIAYNVKLSKLYELNYLNDKSVIYPGQKIKIKGPDPTATPTATATPTHVPTATRRPTRTPRPTQTNTPTGLAISPTPTLIAASAAPRSDPLLIVIAVLIVVGLGLVIAGSLLKRR